MKRIFLIFFNFVLFFLLSGCNGLDVGVVFDDVNGLKKNDPVVLENEKVGTVTDIQYTDRGDFLVSVRIKEAFSDRITENAAFYISAAGHTGADEKHLAIAMAESGGNPLKEGAVVKGRSGSPSEPLDLVFLFEAFERSLKALAEDLEDIPETEQFKRLEKAVARLAQKMKTAGSEAREKIVKEIVPRLREKIEQFEKELEKEGKKEKKEQVKPLKEKLDALQKV